MPQFVFLLDSASKVSINDSKKDIYIEAIVDPHQFIIDADNIDDAKEKLLKLNDYIYFEGIGEASTRHAVKAEEYLSFNHNDFIGWYELNSM